MGLTNLIQGFQVIGLTPPKKVATDISFGDIELKITNPGIARSLGAEVSLPLIEQAEWCANLLDSFSESGDWGFIYEAQRRYSQLLLSLNPEVREMIVTAVASAFNYFSFEQVTAMRIKAGHCFIYEEAAEYLLRRGSDSVIYAILLQELDHLDHAGLVTGFRIRQALWDLADDLRDLEQDRLTIGANILLLSDLGKASLRKLAVSFHKQAAVILPENSPLLTAIEAEYQVVLNLLW